ncbi:MAG: chemotaxis protein CheB [Gallionellaceae bacterium]|nr:chemotaxis protein CheB [Gallionellaceae bacterium]
MTKAVKPAVPKPASVTARKKAAVSVKEKSPPKPAHAAPARDKRRFPIVGIGASAGGLEALESFLTHVRTGSGMAYVVVQHLDPTYKGILPELLQRSTKMTVVEVEDQMKVKPNCVYVIPPNKDLSIEQGYLRLSKPLVGRGLRLPIDLFFRSLAIERHEYAIGVILSGMGSDGTLGLRAIKENSGLCVVQEPTDAKFDSMPRSAITTGVADIVAPAQELPRRIAMFFHHLPKHILEHSDPPLESKTRTALDKIIQMLRKCTGNDFSLYKTNTIYRRIERRMGLHQIDTLSSYARYMQENKQELELLFKELMIGVTSFFRDPVVWEHLQSKAIPALLALYPEGKTLRAWVSACSTGEEAYTLAIAFREALDQIKPAAQYHLQIFATDLDPDAIAKARAAVYPANILADVTPARLARYFVSEDDGYRVSKDIREMIIFATQNIIMDPPFTKLDMLCCRNLLIYFNAELQKKLLPLFYYALAPQGILLLGSAETVGNHLHLFTPVDSKARIYQRLANLLPASNVEFPTKNRADRMPLIEPGVPAPVNSLPHMVEQLLLQSYAPATVLINPAGDILYISGRTGDYLEPAAGKANWNIYAMAREGLRNGLPGAVKSALRQQQAVHLEGVVIGSRTLKVTVQALAEPEILRDKLIVVFQEMPAQVLAKEDKKKVSSRVHATQAAELRQVYEELQSAREEMQTSQEELKSSNEELQSSNEELQSTNEELITSTEEMQSLNEELQMVNDEMETKVHDLSQINNDMNNLLNSTEIAVLFLDDALRVRRFTTHVTQLFKLLPQDVGRPLSDIVTDLDYPELQADAEEVLRSLIFSDKPVTARDNRYFKVRIMPYRTDINVINGVVITFTDITVAKKLEAQLRTALGKVSEH